MKNMIKFLVFFVSSLELRQFGNGAIVAFDSKERSRGAAVRCIRD